jgi:hypothetical protein
VSSVAQQLETFAAAKQLAIVVAIVLIGAEGDPDKALETLAELDTNRGPDGTVEMRSVAEQAVREAVWTLNGPPDA